MKMNRILAIAAAAVMVIMAASCGKSDKDKSHNGIPLKEAEEMFQSELSSSDTTAVLDMGNAFMENLKNGKVEEAIDLLYTREASDSITNLRKLDENERESLRRRFQRFPVVNYKLVSCDFSIPSLNDLKYNYTFTPGANGANLNIMFNPTKRDGKWYLMLKQHDQPAKDAKNALDSTAVIRMN